MFKIIFSLVSWDRRQGGPIPYTPDHKLQTRERIVEAAARLFNRKGFAEVTIGEVMAAAGLPGMSTPLPHLDNDLALSSTLLEIRKRRLRLLEREYLVDHRTATIYLFDLLRRSAGCGDRIWAKAQTY